MIYSRIKPCFILLLFLSLSKSEKLSDSLSSLNESGENITNPEPYNNYDISTDSKCGKLNGKRCPDWECCSIFGQCGTDDEHCIKYCDDKYGLCVSTDKMCGKENGKKCPIGKCCSIYGYCGKSDDHCNQYCDPRYGMCKSSEPSTDGKCGKNNGKRCKDDSCCSKFGYCGTSDDHCIKYCDPNFSECKPDLFDDSIDGECGVKNGKRCPDGVCCSIYGYCGTSELHCIKYCDSEYTECKSYDPDISYDGLCGRNNGKRCPQGECCTINGDCGSSIDHCYTYCDPDYSICKSSDDSDTSTETKCGKKNGERCPDGECCNTSGYCGYTEAHCITECDSNYGLCLSSDDISTDDKCGPENGKRCPFEECCSKYGYCGTSDTHCITACLPSYGLCKTSDDISTDGKCGSENKKRCPENECCSQYGYCGTSDDHCITYCNPDYGMCKF